MRHGQRPERISQFTLVGCDIFVARKKISISAISATSRNPPLLFHKKLRLRSQRKNIRSFLPRFFLLRSCQLFAGARLRRVLLKARSSNLAGYSTLRWTSRQLSRPILREGIFLLVHFSPLFHKRVCSRRLRACKHTRLTPIRFLWYAPSARFIAGEKSKFGRVFYAAKVRLLRLCLCKRGHLGSAAQPFFAGALSFTVCLYLLRLFSLLPAAF